MANRDNRAAVVEVYNNAIVTDEEARREGPMFFLKRFHNRGIKDPMLGRFAYRADRMLDLCCGRGGDVRKWFTHKVKFVKGIDISECSLAEARTRYAEAESQQKRTNAEFVQCSSLGTSEWKDNKEYDVITCMFAMHYFSEREDTMRTFLRNVAINLKPGGVFMGTIASGKRVMQMLEGEDRLETETGMLRLYKMWSKDQEAVVPYAFGMKYICAIADTVTSGNQDNLGSPEFLTFMKPVEDILAEHGIFPVKDYGCQELDQCFDPEDDDETLKHFHPPRSFPEEMRKVSSMFGAFVFRKNKI